VFRTYKNLLALLDSTINTPILNIQSPLYRVTSISEVLVQENYEYKSKVVEKYSPCPSGEEVIKKSLETIRRHRDEFSSYG
jgi:hypothetical protein